MRNSYRKLQTSYEQVMKSYENYEKLRLSYKRVTKRYETLHKVTNELRKSYEQLRNVTKSYKRVIGSDLEASFCEILRNSPPVRGSIKVGQQKVYQA